MNPNFYQTEVSYRLNTYMEEAARHRKLHNGAYPSTKNTFLHPVRAGLNFLRTAFAKGAEVAAHSARSFRMGWLAK